MKKLVTMRHALSSPSYFGGPDMMGADSWAGWRVLLLAIMGEPLTDDERVVFRTLTDREREPDKPVREFTGVIGRRGGKSRAMGTLAAFLAGCVDHRGVLAPGQRGRLPIIAASKDQVDEVLAYVVGAFEQSTALRPLVGNTVERTLSLKSKIDIQVRALSFRNLRGATNIGVICDEQAYWRSDESANPDDEIVAALKPSLATTKGPLIQISSPYAKRGTLYRSFVRDFGPEGRPSRLVAKASTTTLNPAIDPDFLADAYSDDPVAAASEYGCDWRSDISAFISADVVDAAVVQNRTEIPPASGEHYVAFVDVAGGTGGDSYTAAVAHSRPMAGSRERVAVVDLLFEVKPPFSPDDVTETLCEILKRYGIRSVTGDAYGGAWPRERFETRGFKYEVASKQNVASLLDSGESNTGPLFASEIYKTFLALVNGGRVELLDHRKTITQLLTLERHTTPSGKDSITHPKGGHDDCINAVAGACVLAAPARQPLVITQAMLQRLRSNPSPGTDGYYKMHGTYGRNGY